MDSPMMTPMVRYRIYPDDGEAYELGADTRDFKVWEATSKKTFGEFFANMSTTELYRLAHIAAKRQALMTESLQDFEKNNVFEFEVSDRVDPTRKAPSTGA